MRYIRRENNMKDRKFILTVIVIILIVSMLVGGLFLSTHIIVRHHLDNEYVEYTQRYDDN